MIERGSDKHSARRDEALGHDVEGLVRGGGPTHAEEWKDPEPAGEDQPDLFDLPTSAAPPGMLPEDVDLRSELARYLGRAVYPADQPALVDRLVQANAPDRIVDLARTLPGGQLYENVGDVAAALGLGHEAHRF